MNEKNKYKGFYFIVYMGMAAFFSLFPIYLSEVKAFDESYINFLLAVPPFVAIIFQPIWGAVSDVLNSKKKFLLLSLGTLTITLFMMQSIENSIVFILVFLVYSVAFCGFIPLTDALCMNYISQNEKATVNFGQIRLWGSLGFAVSTFLSARIAAYLGLSTIFIVSCLGYGTAFFVLFFIKEYKNKTHITNYFGDINNLSKQKNYVFLLAYLFILLGTIFGSDPTLMLVLRQKGISISQVGTITFLSVVAEMPALFLSGKVVKKYGIYNCMFTVSLFVIIRFIILAFADSFMIFALMQILRGIIIGFSFAMFIDYISSIVPDKLRSSGIAIYTTVTQGLGQSFFLIIIGLLVSHFTNGSIFITLAVLNFLNVFIIRYLKRIA